MRRSSAFVFWAALAAVTLAASGMPAPARVPADCGWASEFFLSDLDGKVEALVVYDDGDGAALYAAGEFILADGVEVNHIAKWDGMVWSALSGPSGTGTSGRVNALAVYDDGGGEALQAGGSFYSAGGVSASRIAKWDGAVWSALSNWNSPGIFDTVNALAVFDDGGGAALYAGGDFITTQGIDVNYIAKWDGTVSSALSGPAGTGMSGVVHALAVYDDGSGAALYAGGDFVTAGGIAVNHIAKWDGTGWSALTSAGGTGTNDLVRALAVVNDDDGPALYVGGQFSSAGGQLGVGHVARWKDSTWARLPGLGTDRVIGALMAHGNGGEALLMGGWFDRAGGIPASNLSRFVFCVDLFFDGFESGDTSAWNP